MQVLKGGFICKKNPHAQQKSFRCASIVLFLIPVNIPLLAKPFRNLSLNHLQISPNEKVVFTFRISHQSFIDTFLSFINIFNFVRKKLSVLIILVPFNSKNNEYSKINNQFIKKGGIYIGIKKRGF